MGLQNRLHRRATYIVLFAVWLLAVGAGTHSLLIYANTPGRLAAPPRDWPAAGHLITRVPGHATLVMFAHPQCPCSTSSIGELAWVLTRAAEKPDVTVFFYYPATEGEVWARTGLWSSAVAIPSVRAIADRDGTAARRFGASTSGQVLLYNGGGQLVFNGGITAARGHFGNNAGSDSLVALLSGPMLPTAATRAPHTTPVFGCSLVTAE